MDSVTGMSDTRTIYESQDDEQIIELEIFKNYMAFIVELKG